METFSEGCSFGILTLNFGRSENADRTSSGQCRARGWDQRVGPNCGIENRAGDADLTGEIAGQRQMVPGIGNRFDD